MREEYNLDELTPKKNKTLPLTEPVRSSVNMEIDARIMSKLTEEAYQLNISESAFIEFILARYANGDLVPKAINEELKDLIIRIKKEVG